MFGEGAKHNTRRRGCFPRDVHDLGNFILKMGGKGSNTVLL